MKTKKLPIIISTLCILAMSAGLFNCTGKKQMNKGDYAGAVYSSINKLRNKPNHKKATLVLQQAYPLALSYTHERIDIAKRSADPFKWNTIVQHMETANRMADEISRSPAARAIIPNPTRFDNELPQAREYAAEECYSAGILELQRGTRERAREAYRLFQCADRFVKNYKAVDSLLYEAHLLATLKVVLEQIPVGAGRLEISAEFFQNNVEAYINELFERKEFVQLFLPHQMMNVSPDHIIRIKFDDFVVGNTIFSEKTTTVTSKDSVLVGEHVDSEGKKHNVYNRVSANYTSYRKEVISQGIVDVSIIEFHSGKILLQDKLPGQFVWVSQWASFNGDERALTQQQIALTKQRRASPPPPQDLFVEFTKPIFDQIASRISSFYARY